MGKIIPRSSFPLVASVSGTCRPYTRNCRKRAYNFFFRIRLGRIIHCGEGNSVAGRESVWCLQFLERTYNWTWEGSTPKRGPKSWRNSCARLRSHHRRVRQPPHQQRQKEKELAIGQRQCGGWEGQQEKGGGRRKTMKRRDDATVRSREKCFLNRVFRD